MCPSLSCCTLALALLHAVAAQRLPTSPSASSSATAALPPVTPSLVHAMNVSQEEYMRTFRTYIERLRDQDYSSSYGKKYFLTFTHSGDIQNLQHSIRQLEFMMRLGSGASVERATLRLLVSGEKCRVLKFFQLRDDGSEKELKSVEPRKDLLPQWKDVEADVRALSGDGARFRVDAPGCMIASPALHIILTRTSKREKRGIPVGRTDCDGPSVLPPSLKKMNRCCRSQMEIIFKDTPGYEFIVEPYKFEAGVCGGDCPYRFNPANNHATLKGLMFELQKFNVTKNCCAPTKLEPLQIIYMDEDHPEKLITSTWKDMRVLECSCA